ncbi:MAG: peptidase S10, partial [Brevundimonas sp.]
MRHLLTAVCATALLAAPMVSAAQEASGGGSGPVRSAADRLRNANAEQVERNWARASVEEKEVTTSHSITAHGRAMRYKATAGTLTIRDDAGMPTASLFYVAYTLDGQPVGRRPVTYLSNGGPGSPTVWLHMGAF